jgi:hypothetical protein
VTHKVIYVTHTGKKCLICNLMDMYGEEIRSVAWNENGDKYENMLHVSIFYNDWPYH